MSHESRRGEWMQTFTGIQFWPCDPRAEEIRIADVAHALSMQCRYGGHCREFYSVAEHSWRASKVCDPKNALWALLHDAAEAYLVDLPRPIKRHSALGDEYRKMETKLMLAVCERFGLDLEEPYDVKQADELMLHWEARDLMGPHPAPWANEGTFKLPSLVMSPMSPRIAEQAFLERYIELGGSPWR